MTAQHCDTTDLVHDRILDAAEELILTRGIAGFTLDGVAQAAGVSKGGLLYHFRSKDSLISGMQRRMVSRVAETLREAKAGSEPVLQAFVRHLRRDYERGGRSFAPLLLAREREEPCEELQALMACIARESGVDGDGKGSTLLLLAALGLMLSSLARLPCPLPEHASDLLDELESATGRIGDVGSHAV
ncbi:MAG TPA: TetR/AcrR family transcriptional regulator [Microvirga sp.]|nr:TetR/AcrR family transcriptional regulator [Microvirga sp.]